MAIYRNIQMSFWTDTKIESEYTPEDKLFYLYLMTNPHTNLCGCYEISISQMSSEIGYKVDTVKKLLKRMTEVHRSVVYAENTKEILLVNWHKYNWTSSEKFKKSLMKEIRHVKTESFRTYLEKISEGDPDGYGIDTVCIPYAYPIDTVSNQEGYGMDTTVTVTDTDIKSKGISSIKEKQIKHKYGEYENVLLTDKELEKLKTEFPYDWEKRIESLSVYMKSKGTSYKDHLATIRNWSRREKESRQTKKSGSNYSQREVDYDSMIESGLLS